MTKKRSLFTTIVLLIIFSWIILSCAQFADKAQASVPLPPPPSQEKLDEMKRLGDENLEKYGAGPSAPIQPTNAPVSPSKQPQPTKAPTTLPTPKPTATISASISPNAGNSAQLTQTATQSAQQKSFAQLLKASWQQIAGQVSSWFKNLFKF